MHTSHLSKWESDGISCDLALLGSCKGRDMLADSIFHDISQFREFCE